MRGSSIDNALLASNAVTWIAPVPCLNFWVLKSTFWSITVPWLKTNILKSGFCIVDGLLCSFDVDGTCCVLIKLSSIPVLVFLIPCNNLVISGDTACVILIPPCGTLLFGVSSFTTEVSPVAILRSPWLISISRSDDPSVICVEDTATPFITETPWLIVTVVLVLVGLITDT